MSQRYGATIPLRGVALSQHRTLLEELAQLGYTDVWTGEASSYDAFTPLTLAAAWAPGLRLGTSVVPVQTRGPALLAMTAASLAEAAPGRVVLGVGSSGPPFVERINGIPFAEPYKRVRDTVCFLRAAFTGEHISGHFDSFDIAGFALEPPPSEPIRLVVGALRPGMIRLATTLADGMTTNFLSAEDLRRVTAAIGPARPAKEVIVRIFVCPTRDRNYARHIGRRMLVGILNASTYSAFHDWLGRGAELEASHRAWAVGDYRAAQAAIPDHVVDALLVHGDPDQCRAHIQRYVDHGTDTPVLAIVPAPEFGSGPEGMLGMLRALAPTRIQGAGCPSAPQPT